MKYNVKIKFNQTTIYEVEVEADNETDAKKFAYDLMEMNTYADPVLIDGAALNGTDKKLITEYRHINDCWSEIRKAKTIEEVNALFETFPRWSGDWEVMVEDGQYIVYNTWFDKLREDYDVDCEVLDIEVEEDYL